jgi:hypothetical protein
MKATKQAIFISMFLVAANIAVAALEVKQSSYSLSEIAYVSSSPQRKEEGIETEEYAVYAALITENVGENNAELLLVINEMPSPWITPVDAQADFYEKIKEDSPALLTETVDDLRAKNKESFKLTRNFNIKPQYVLVSEQDLSFDAKAGDWWKTFHDKYPKARGIMTFSRVGFNSNKTQALVYRANHCGGLCGGGNYYLLRKKNGVWVIEGVVGPSWVS